MAVAFDPFTIAADLAQCICQALKAEERAEDVWAGECCVRPGSQVPWDSCCDDGGQAWVAMQGGFPTVTFPVQDTATSTVCGNIVSLALNFEVGVLRCIGNSTDCDTLENVASKVFGDLKAMINALNCCFESTDEDDEPGWRLNSIEMLGPQGGCVGSKIIIAVNTEYPCCPPPAP